MTSKPNLRKGLHPDMLVQASEKGQVAYIGRVVGLKHHRYIKLSRQSMPDGKRRCIPLEWVRSVKGNIVHLGQTASPVRHGWLGRADLKAEPQVSPTAEARAEARVPFKSGKSGG